MLGGLFKKKETDDFSDFSTDAKSTPGMSTDPDQHLGLPLDGDMTKTSPDLATTSGFSPTSHTPTLEESPPSGPGAFDRLDSFSKASERFTHQTQMPQQEQSSKSFEKDIQIVNAKIRCYQVFYGNN